MSRSTVFKAGIEKVGAWIDVPLIKGGLHHASGALAAAATFRAIGCGIEMCVSEALIRLAVQRIEGIVLVTIYAVLAMQMLSIESQQRALDRLSRLVN